MKIAVSGAHRTGKTTLVEALADARPGFARFDEPYYQLEAEGHVFAAEPDVEDFELQLERAVHLLRDSEGDCLFDRCPADLLAYLLTHDDAASVDIEGRLPAVREAMQRLDLVVFVPIEEPDRVPATDMDDADLRRRVHEELEDMVLHDAMGFGVPALEVTGTPAERLRRVLAQIGGDP